jgi:uncharacterized protein
MEKHIFHVTGMHCRACVLMTESELQGVPYVSCAKTCLKKECVEVTGEFDGKDPTTIAADLTLVLTKHGYSLSVEKQKKTKNWNEFRSAVPIALAFIIAFALLQKAGVVNLIGEGEPSYATAFIVGLVASVSTCMAVVGGLVLSMSATFSKEGNAVKPQLMFHAGRIVSFFLLGGVIGVLGSAFRLNPFGSLVLGIVLGFVMFILGLNLLDVFDWTKKLQPSTPKFLSKHALGVSKFNHTLTPLLVGVVTFFLPCGFTQSMQLYALSTGSFFTGGLTMLAFALGSFPVLALISFSSFSVEKSRNKGVFFKTAGLIVIAFAAFNVLTALVAAGYIAPIFNF